MAFTALGLFANTGEALAQSNSGSSLQNLYNQAYDYLLGADKGTTQNYYVRGKKVAVTVAELSAADRKLLGGDLIEVSNSIKGNEDLEVADVALAPNKDGDKMYLTFSAPEDEEDTEIIVLDVHGNEVHKEAISEFAGTYESPISISAAEDATYFLKIVQGFSLTNKKLIVE